MKTKVTQLCLTLCVGFPGSSAGKESACHTGDPGLIPGSGRSAGKGIGYPLQYSWASLVAQLIKNPPAMWETWVLSLGWEDSLEKGTATHSNILAWRIPWTWGHKELDTTERLSLHYYLCACVLIYLCSVCTQVCVCAHTYCFWEVLQPTPWTEGWTQSWKDRTPKQEALVLLIPLSPVPTFPSSLICSGFLWGLLASMPIRILSWALLWPKLAGDSRRTLMSPRGQESVDPADRCCCLGEGFLEPPPGSCSLKHQSQLPRPALSPDLSPPGDGYVSCCHQARLAVLLGGHRHFIPSPSCVYLSSSTKGIPINFH